MIKVIEMNIKLANSAKSSKRTTINYTNEEFDDALNNTNLILMKHQHKLYLTNRVVDNTINSWIGIPSRIHVNTSDVIGYVKEIYRESIDVVIYDKANADIIIEENYLAWLRYIKIDGKMRIICFDLYSQYGDTTVIDNTLKVREYSTEICELFENILDTYNIDIPDDDRTGNEGEARLYGMTYAGLEEDITSILIEITDRIKANPNIEINKTNL